MYVIVPVELHITYDTDDYRLQVDPANTRINDVCMTFAMTIDTYHICFWHMNFRTRRAESTLVFTWLGRNSNASQKAGASAVHATKLPCRHNSMLWPTRVPPVNSLALEKFL